MQSTYDRIQWYRLSPQQKAQIKAKLKALLDKQANVRSAWIFGSFTEQGGIRDIDIAIETVSEYSFKEYLGLNGELSLEVGVPIDLVEMDKAPQSLREEVVKNGIKIK